MFLDDLILEDTFRPLILPYLRLSCQQWACVFIDKGALSSQGLFLFLPFIPCPRPPIMSFRHCYFYPDFQIDEGTQ